MSRDEQAAANTAPLNTSSEGAATFFWRSSLVTVRVDFVSSLPKAWRKL